MEKSYLLKEKTSESLRENNEALRKSEEKYRKIFESASDAMIFLDKFGRIFDANRKALEIFGGSKEEMLGKHFARLGVISLRDIPRLVNGFARSLVGKEIIHDVCIKNKKGQEIHLDCSGSLLKIRDEFAGILVIARDVTERKKAEEELIRLSSAVKMSTDSIVISDLNAKIIDVNEATLKMYGTDDKRDLIGKNSFDLIAPEEREKALTGMREVLEKGYIKSREYNIVTKDGSRIPVGMSVSIMKDADGKPIGFVGISRDITERKKAEQALRESEEKFRNIFEGVNDEILYVDKYGKIVDVNKRVEDIFGYKRDEVIGKDFARLGILQPEDLPIMLKQFMDAMRDGVVYPLMEYEIKDKKGNKVPVEASTRLVKKNGKIEGLLVIVRDVRERKKMEEALKRQRDIAITLSGAGNLMEALNRLFDNLLEMEEFDCVGFYLFDNETGTLDMIVHRGLPDKFVEKVSHFDADSPYTKVVLEGKALYQKTSDFPSPLREDIQSSGIRSVAAIPIHYEGAIIGHLNMASYTYDEISVSTRHVLESVSAQIGETIIRVRMEEKLRESEEKYRTMVELAPDLIITVNKEGIIVSCNFAAESGSGYSKDEIIGKHFLESPLLHGIDAAYAQKLFNSMMKEELREPIEITWLHKDGTSRTSEIRFSLIKIEGKITGFTAIVRDITERKEMEEKLRQYSERLEELVKERTEELLESEKRYSVLVEEASDGVAILQDEKIVFTNKKGAEIIGYSKDELIGLPFEKVVSEEYRQLAKERYERRLRGEMIPSTYEIGLIAKTGERVPVELSATHIHHQGRSADLLVVRDIRERKRLEEERLKLGKLAAIGELATMVGHDLRNPLTGIIGAEYYLKKKYGSKMDNKAKEMLEIIEKNIEHSNKIINDLLEYSKEIKIELTESNPKQVIREALSLVDIPTNIQVIDLTENQPKTNFDTEKIKRAIINVVKNAIEAMPEGGTLTIKSKESNGNLEIAFTDTGIGMPKDITEKLFTPLFTTKAKGMGFGLPICKRIIEAHGGKISVESAVGKGATFTIIIPIKQKSERGEKIWVNTQESLLSTTTKA